MNDTAGPPLRIGTSGWSYPSGRGTWNGVFYPRRGEAGGGGRFDELAFYARYFDTVEVNSSFYRPPDPKTTRGWTERTPPGFEFSLKLYQKFTHPEMFHRATGQDPAQLGAKDVDEFRRGLEPIAGAGKLGALLAQFPPSFQASDQTRDYLEWLLDAFRGYPLAVELRHRTWSDARDSTLALLEAFGAAWAQIDEPKFRLSVRQDRRPNAALYYMRLHGRNADKWWRHEAAEDRYDYLYSGDELRPLAESADRAQRQVRRAYLYLNNHFAAKSVANAAVLRHMLGQPAAADYPASLIARYPEIAAAGSRSG